MQEGGPAAEATRKGHGTCSSPGTRLASNDEKTPAKPTTFQTMPQVIWALSASVVWCRANSS